MSTQKRIWLAVVIVLIVGGIWYLESIKAGPNGAGGPGQAIDVLSNQDNSSTTVAGSATSVTPANDVGTGAAGGQVIPQTVRAIALADEKAGDKPAIEIVDPTGFVNAPSSFTLKSLVGKKVILVDFWTYSCINCIRTIPYLDAWYSKYANDGLEIVGIHTPEFDFEKNIANVQTAVKQDGIQYPVILDSNYGTWDAYGNLYWPHEYLIDIAGYIVHDHVGEGDYDVTEATIQQLLQERATALGQDPALIPTSTVNLAAPDLSDINSPETYFGANRNSLLANGYAMTNGTQLLADPGSSVALNQLYLVGSWDFEDEYATNNQAGAKVIYEYDSSKVYIVASAPNGATVEVLQDGKPIGAAAGSDVVNGKVTITGSRLYNLVNNPDGSGEHTLELIVDSPGLQAFTFTFG